MEPHSPSRCPQCGSSLCPISFDSKSGLLGCPACTAQYLPDQFFAHGQGVMSAQEWKQLLAYSISTIFFIASIFLIMSAPDDSQLPADIAARALLILAAVVSGYTYFKAKKSTRN